MYRQKYAWIRHGFLVGVIFQRFSLPRWDLTKQFQLLPQRSYLGNLLYPKDHWTLKTGYFQVPYPCYTGSFTLPLEGPRSLNLIFYSAHFGETRIPYLITLHQPFWGDSQPANRSFQNATWASRWTPKLGTFMDLLQGFLSSLGCAKTAWVEHHSFFGTQKNMGKQQKTP